MIALRRIFLSLVALVLLWQIAVVGISQQFADLAALGDPMAASKSLFWSESQPQALLRQAQQLLEQDPQAASRLGREAYQANPSDPAPLFVLAQSAPPESKPETTEAYVQAATQLAPANAAIAEKAAAFWVGRGDLPKAVQYWSRALEADFAASERTFPILLHIVEDPQARMVFADYARQPPSWWPRFFAEVARRALDVETVRFLYALRRAPQSTTIGEDERAAYIARLKREGLTTEAYLVWLNGLDQENRHHLGLLFNGGFELELTDSGFDWRRIPLKGVAITTAKTYGTDGEKSLQLLFRKTEDRFRHLIQDLYIQPGRYRVLGKARPDGLQGTGGLQWAVRCSPEAAPLATSERFLGSSQWRDFSFEFDLPKDCGAPQIVLQSVGERPAEHQLTGAIWFDVLRLRAIPPPPVAPAT